MRLQALAPLLALLCLLTLAACRTGKVASPGKEPSPEELISRAQASSQKLTSLVGEVKVDYFDRKGGAGGRVKGKSLFMIERPRNLRFDVLTPFEQPLAILVSNGEKFALLDMQAKAFYQGPPTAENIARLFQLQFSDEEIVRALLGETLILGAPEKQEVSYDKKSGAWVLTLTQGTKQQILRYEGSHFLLTESTLTEGGEVIYRISYKRYQPVEGIEGAFLPHEIFFEKPREKADVKLRVVGELNINGELDPSHFTLSPSPGMQVIDVP